MDLKDHLVPTPAAMGSREGTPSTTPFHMLLKGLSNPEHGQGWGI